MGERYRVAVIGSGPAGLSAAARAAERRLSHVLLEATPYLASTIYRYQKGKHVMDEPTILPLRSPVSFAAGTREHILEGWDKRLRELQVNVRHGAEVTAITGQKGAFELKLANGSSLQAEYVVLAIGLQGNLRKLGAPGEDLPWVQYQLDDPKEYSGETIVVVGAGDAAIENAIALAEQNTVVMLNRGDEFNRAKQGNLNSINKAIKDGQIECYFKTGVARAENFAQPDAEGRPGQMVLKTATGQAEVACHRVIARLGATPPRKFVESCGVKFPSNDPAAVPAVSATYESNVPGLYIIGALAGFPLIKQAMNQGYEVIEFIEGHTVEPADEPLLRDKFKAIPGFRSVDETLGRIQREVPVLSGLTKLQLREFMLDSKVHAPKPGEIIFKRNDYTNSFYSILTGEVNLQINPKEPSQVINLRQGQFFGEMGLISGRRRSVTALAGQGCALIETPRRSMNKLISSVESVRRTIDEVFLLRAIQSQIAPGASVEELQEVILTATIQRFNAGDVLFREGDPGDSLHLIRVGSVTVARNIGGKETVFAYVPAGKYIGEMALLAEGPRTATVRATVATETIRLDGTAFKQLLLRVPSLRQRLRKQFETRAKVAVQVSERPETGSVLSFLIAQGLGEATDVLLIDESLCVRCDNCEKACGETHGGVSRLNREAGPTYATLHVPTSCRHCEHPHCMKDCPPDAIHRAPNGEVYIADNCIGCGNCQRNCPYGVIQMGVVGKPRQSVLWWLLTGLGHAPGAEWHPEKPKDGSQLAKKAVKCDMCKDLKGGPACVRACPTGAALRVSPEQFMNVVR